jgi:hypothetical protein
MTTTVKPYGLARVANFTLYADDIPVWLGEREPSQAAIDAAARSANRRGWNGTTLDLHTPVGFLQTVECSDGALGVA